jgi:hypothetical protein
MGQVDSKIESQIFNSTVGSQIYGLTRDYVDSCHTLTDEYKLCKPFYYFVTADAKGQVRNCTGDCVISMQQQFDAMLMNGQRFGQQWPFFAQIKRSSDLKEYIVPLRYSISFLLKGPKFRQFHRVRINADVPEDDRDDVKVGDKIDWHPAIHDIMYQFANHATTTRIVLSFTDPTIIDKRDIVVVTKLLDSKNQEIDFPLDQQRISPDDDEPEEHPDDWYIALTISRPRNLPLPGLVVPRLPEDDMIPNLPAQAPLYGNQVIRRPPYRRA